MADQRPTRWATPDRETSITACFYKDSGRHAFVVFTNGRSSRLCATANEAAKAINWPANLPTGAEAREFLKHWGYEPHAKAAPAVEPNDQTRTII